MDNDLLVPTPPVGITRGHSIVTATDETGTITRSGTFDPGRAPSLKRADGGIDMFVDCDMPFEIQGLPEVEGYRVAFGNGRYVDLPYEQIVRDGWIVEIKV